MARAEQRDAKGLGLWRPWFELFPADRLFEGQQDEIRVDEYRDDGNLVIRAEAPGLDPDKDLKLNVEDGYLRLDVDRHKATRVADDDYVREEMRYGHFARRLRLPAGCKESEVTATYRDGILEVRVPMGGTESRAIPISVTK